MNRTAGIVSIFAAIALAGCSLPSQTEPETTTVTQSSETSEGTPEMSSSTSDQAFSDEEFADVIKDNTDLDGGSTQDYVTGAEAICKQFAMGGNFYDIGTTLVTDFNYLPEDAGYFIGASVNNYCPEYVDDMKRQIEENEEDING